MNLRADTAAARESRGPEASWCEAPLAPTDDLVALLFRGASSTDPAHGWAVPAHDGEVVSRVLRPLLGSPWRLGNHEETPVGGRATLREVTPESSAFGASALEWFDFAHAGSVPVNIHPRVDGSPVREFSGHERERLVAVAENWIDQSPGLGESWARARLSVHVAALDATEPRLLTTFDGGEFADEDGASVQWSPDGTAIALCRRWVDLRAPEKGWLRAVVVVSADTGAVVASWPGATLAGTASWSPDSARLLIQPDARTTAVQDVRSDRRYPVALPPRRPDGFRDRRALALIDDERVLVVEERRGRTVLSIDRTDGERSWSVLTWRAPYESHPRVSALAPEVWDRVLRSVG